MPAITIHREVTVQQAATALEHQLGHDYVVTRRGRDALTVKRGALTSATVRLQWADDATAFHVHGRGLVISRVVNELGIARTVTGALEQSLEPGRRPHLSASG